MDFQQLRFELAFFDGVLGPPCLAQCTWLCPYVYVVQEATHEVSRGHLKGAVLAQKALQGSWIGELLGGTEENSVSLMRGHWFFTKRKQKKIELVARPGAGARRPRPRWSPPSAGWPRKARSAWWNRSLQDTTQVSTKLQFCGKKNVFKVFLTKRNHED